MSLDHHTFKISESCIDRALAQRRIDEQPPPQRFRVAVEKPSLELTEEDVDLLASPAGSVPQLATHTVALIEAMKVKQVWLDAARQTIKSLQWRLDDLSPSGDTVPLAKYLDEPHARNVSGKRTIGDLTIAEIRTLSRADLATVAVALSSVLRVKDIELARHRAENYLAKRDVFSALHTNALRDLEIAELRNRGEPCDNEP